MKKFDIDFPIAGLLHFYNVEAENKREAIDECYNLVSNMILEMKDPIKELDGEWDMYERFTEGNVICINDNRVEVYESE